MRRRIEVLWRYLLIALLFFVIAIPTVLVLLAFLLLVTPIVVITSLPAWIGAIFPIDTWIRSVIDRYFDINRMQRFRDDMLHILPFHMEIRDEMDEYWMLREMDAARERIDSKLRNGMLMVALIAGLTSIVLTVSFPIQYAGALLSAVAIGISLAAFYRIVIIDILAFDSSTCQEAPYDEIALRLGWNQGPIHGKSAILVAFGTIVAGIDESGYRLGKEVVGEIVAWRNPGEEEKWRREEEDPEEQR